MGIVGLTVVLQVRLSPFPLLFLSQKWMYQSHTVAFQLCIPGCHGYVPWEIYQYCEAELAIVASIYRYWLYQVLFLIQSVGTLPYAIAFCRGGKWRYAVGWAGLWVITGSSEKRVIFAACRAGLTHNTSLKFC